MPTGTAPSLEDMGRSGPHIPGGGYTGPHQHGLPPQDPGIIPDDIGDRLGGQVTPDRPPGWADPAHRSVEGQQ
jgi:hypothetical protein